MPDLKTTVNTATRETQINIGSTGTAVIATLATLGALEVTNGVVRIGNKIRVRRAAKKAAKVVKTDAQQ
jgi:hypothetical protein